MRYWDFEIDIQSTENGELEARVLRAPFQDRPKAVFPPPLEPSRLKRFRRRAEDHVQSPDGAASRKKDPELSHRAVGNALYEALLDGDLGDLFRRCRASLLHDERAGLRIRLVFHLADPQADYLAALPWELLCDPTTGMFLARDIETPVVRQLVNSNPVVPLEVDGPLRILVADVAPKGMEELELELELELMEEALGVLTAAGEVELLHLPEASPEKLRDVLRDEVVHVLHLMGHGGYDAGSGIGALFFAAPDGGKDQVDGEMLGDLLKSVKLRLVVLNACKTARHAGRTRASVHYGAASGIVERTRIPAVVANQFSISDEAAIDWAEVFYHRLAARDPVDTALTEARLRLSWRTPEWATPVLFLSAEDGKLFSGGTSKKRRAIVLAPEPARVEEPAFHLGLLSFTGDEGEIWGDMEENCDAIHDFRQWFDPDSPLGRLIREPHLWQEKIFPRLRGLLRGSADQHRKLLLDFAAHQSIAFAAGWLLEAKSGLDVQVRQRTIGRPPSDWHPSDGSAPEGELWQEREDYPMKERGPDVAVALDISGREIAPEVGEFIERKGLPIGRIIDATVARPGHRSVLGGQHALRLAQVLVHRTRQRRPHERGGRLHLFGAAPNAFLFYLGQLSRSLGRVVLYEYPFGMPESYGRYQRSIELPPPDEAVKLPSGW